MTTNLIAAILFLALAAAYPLHLRAMRKAAATAEVRAEMRTKVYAETAASQRITIGYLDARVGRLDDDVLWALEQAVLHDERHACLPSLDGIRAGAGELPRSGNVLAFGRRG